MSCEREEPGILLREIGWKLNRWRRPLMKLLICNVKRVPCLYASKRRSRSRWLWSSPQSPSRLSSGKRSERQTPLLASLCKHHRCSGRVTGTSSTSLSSLSVNVLSASFARERALPSGISAVSSSSSLSPSFLPLSLISCLSVSCGVRTLLLFAAGLQQEHPLCCLPCCPSLLGC